jgi:hypothetical protein
MSTLTEGTHAGHYLVSEAPGYRSRDAATIANTSGAALLMAAGLVLVSSGAGALTVTPGANTGNGVLTPHASAPVGATAQVGTYTARCITAATNGGTFRITDPAGDVLGDVAVGTEWNNQIRFTIADGATDFVVNDSFSLAVAAGDGSLVPFTNATGRPAVAVLFGGVTVPASGSRPCTITARDAEVNAAELQYDASLSGAALTAAKAAAKAQLALQGIILR